MKQARIAEATSKIDGFTVRIRTQKREVGEMTLGNLDRLTEAGSSKRQRCCFVCLGFNADTVTTSTSLDFSMNTTCENMAFLQRQRQHQFSQSVSQSVGIGGSAYDTG